MIDARLIAEPWVICFLIVARLTYIGIREVDWVSRAQEFVRYLKICQQLSDVLTAAKSEYHHQACEQVKFP